MQLRSPRPGPPGRGLGLRNPLKYPRFHEHLRGRGRGRLDLDVDLDANVDADVVAVVLLDESTV